MALTKSKTSEYRAYIDAKQRCTNTNCSVYDYYGARGIEFRFSSFDEFIAEIGWKPDQNLTLDRIDVDGHYEKGNVHWATHSHQMRNRRRYKKPSLIGNTFNARCYRITHPDGHTEDIFNMAEFCREYNLDKANLHMTTKYQTRKHKGFKAEVI